MNGQHYQPWTPNSVPVVNQQSPQFYPNGQPQPAQYGGTPYSPQSPGNFPQGQQSPRPAALPNLSSPNVAPLYQQHQLPNGPPSNFPPAIPKMQAQSQPSMPLSGAAPPNQGWPNNPQAINRTPMMPPVYNGQQVSGPPQFPASNGNRTPTMNTNPSPAHGRPLPPMGPSNGGQNPGFMAGPPAQSPLSPSQPPMGQGVPPVYPIQQQNQSPVHSGQRSFPTGIPGQQQPPPFQASNQAPLNQGRSSGPPIPGSYQGPAPAGPVPAQGPPTSQFGAPQAQRMAQRPLYPTVQQNGYPTSRGDYNQGQQQLANSMAGMSVRDGMNKIWGTEAVNLLQEREVLSMEPPINDFARRSCSPDVMRCTMLKIPETSSLLQKSRLPLGIVLQPFKDLEDDVPIIQSQTIVRCRVCRTYINPFIQFLDKTRWKCNICFRVNDLPTDFMQDPATGRFGDPEMRPEVQNGTVEYIAPSEYMVRPPQAATYLFVLDVSFQAVETGYLKVAADMIAECLDDMPGDGRTTVGFITFDTAVHFYSMDGSERLPRQMVITEVDDIFIPYPESLLCNLKECRTQIESLLQHLGSTQEGGSGNCLGAALQAAYKLLSPVGGRVSVFQCCLPNIGPGALQSRENPNERSAQEVANLNPATDFYKKLALDCSGVQIAVDLFLLSSQFADLATISGISKFTAGQVHFYPKFHVTMATDQVERFRNELHHYLTRKIGFEAVMRIRCTKGLQLHTFHGNFFVRSVDLLSLPNVNPDAGFAMQISIEENLTDCNTAAFQAAVLHTTASGERRIRVHTLCVGVSALLSDILHSADQEAVVAMLAKMAVDRTVSCSINDARDAMINAAADLCHAFTNTQRAVSGGLLIMRNCKTLPLFVLGLLKQRAFRVGVSTKLDERIYDMERIKNLPIYNLLLLIYPALYPLHLDVDEPPRVQLSFEKVDKNGLYLLETVDCMYIYVGGRLPTPLLQNIFAVSKFSQLPDHSDALPELNNPDSIRMRSIVDAVASRHAVPPPLWVLREDSQHRQLFTQYMLNDRGESVLSYYEFLQHLRNQLDSY